MFQQQQQQIILFLIFIQMKFLYGKNSFPEILTKTSDQTFNFSSTAILKCHIRNLNEYHVTWFKYDLISKSSYPLAVGENLFTNDKRYSISSYPTANHDSIWLLEIYDVNLSDEGIYLCKISNRKKSISVSIHLHVQIPMNLSPTNVYVEPGTYIKLNCSILIDNQTNDIPINWHFLSNQLNHTKFHDVYTRKKFINQNLISYLIINHAQTYHSGIWTCVYKRQRRTAKLIIEKSLFLMISFVLFFIFLFRYFTTSTY